MQRHHSEVDRTRSERCILGCRRDCQLRLAKGATKAVHVFNVYFHARRALWHHLCLSDLDSSDASLEVHLLGQVSAGDAQLRNVHRDRRRP